MPVATDKVAELGLTDRGFKNADARRRYMSVYDEVRALTPHPDVVHDVPTEFGTVRVYQHGPDGGVPVVLIHGFFLTSAMWREQVAGLSGDFTLYAIDALGQPGASIQERTMFTPAQCARGINAVLDGLTLRDVHLVGHSYGGWLAAHTAARAPHLLATVTLIDPANTVARLSPRFWRSLAVVMTRPRSAGAEQAADWIAGHPAPGSYIGRLAQLFVAGFDAFGPPIHTPAPRFPRERLLRTVRLPVQVLLAGNTVHDSGKAIEWIASAVPSWRYHMWPNASHMLPAEASDEVNAQIRQFVIAHHNA
ncbi:alpha/beta fold hydrolase [Mycolicibacterium houstonense]|uniref:alpha/beta fold hydrolase n=1 Tax=Mycolicibacterium houstonense TaxID=146021 RepID=UPI00082F2932|nr:alpha/beta hydrolase [Mycolicibacterium houstonense]